MTGQELYDLTTTLLDDSDLDIETFLVLANVAKNRREDMRPWQFLKKLDSSKTASTGDTYQTAKALPSDFRLDYKVMKGEDIELTPVPFEEQHIYRNSPNGYFIDLASGYYYLTGTHSASKTIYFFYIKTTDDITANTSPVWPARFHPIIAYDVAGFVMNGVDADDIYARMAPEQKSTAMALELAMTTWDNALKLRAMNHSYSGNAQGAETPLSQM